MQSTKDLLNITLYPVKKQIYLIKDEWSPKSFVISFKLETDENILIHKSIKSIEQAKSDFVIANLLQTRYDRVLIINKLEKYEISKGNCSYIEENIVNKITQLHDDYINKI